MAKGRLSTAGGQTPRQNTRNFEKAEKNVKCNYKNPYEQMIFDFYNQLW